MRPQVEYRDSFALHQWRRHHAKHHGAWNDFDHRNASGRDIYSSCLTVAEYNALGTWRRRVHRTAKHPAISRLVLPPLIAATSGRFCRRRRRGGLEHRAVVLARR
jgi:fatty acid desaturase